MALFCCLAIPARRHNQIRWCVHAIGVALPQFKLCRCIALFRIADQQVCRGDDLLGWWRGFGLWFDPVELAVTEENKNDECADAD